MALPRSSGGKTFEQNCLRDWLESAAARALNDAAENQEARLGASPQKKEAIVKPVTDIISMRLRPKIIREPSGHAAG